MAAGVVHGTLSDYAGGTEDRFEPKPGFDEEIIRVTAGAAREGFAWSFRHGALLVLSVLPLTAALRRTPAQARAAAMAQQGQASQQPGDGRAGDGRAGDGAAAPDAVAEPERR